jgi:hypothetical protein
MTRRAQSKRNDEPLEKDSGSVVRVAKIDLTEVADEAPIFLSQSSIKAQKPKAKEEDIQDDSSDEAIP